VSTVPAASDVLLVGGGLANGLVAWRLRQVRPELRVRLVERAPTLGGEHTWSFHDADLTPSQHAWLAPLVARRWPAHDVRFPGLARRLRGGYRSLTSRRLHESLLPALGGEALLGRAVRAVDPGGATLEDGTRLAARCVVDGRGFVAGDWLCAGVQKFVGLDVTLASDHGLDAPLLMDATVPQTGGFRFFYLLPLLLYFFQSFVDAKRPEWLWLACLTAVAWVLGNVPYFVPMWALVLAIVCAAPAIGYGRAWREL